MATAEVISLASSPLRFSAHDIALLSSSPLFPSPGALLRRQPQFRTVRQACTTQEHAVAPPQTTADLSTNEAVGGTRHTNRSPSPAITLPAAKKTPVAKTPRTKNASKSRKSNPDDGPDQPSAKKPRKPLSKNADAPDGEAVAPKEKAPRKPRIKKDKTDGQTKLANGSITKASASSKVEKIATKRHAETVINRISTAVADLGGLHETHKVSKNDLLLQEAVKRRINWTPPKPTASRLDLTGRTVGSDGSSADTNLNGDKQKTIFNLLGSFGYKNGEQMPPTERIANPIGPRKRKLIELVKTSAVAPETPAAKLKAPKKKPRTITEQAISAYAVKDTEDDDAQQAPLVQDLSHEGSALIKNGAGLFNGTKVRARTHSKSPVKGSRAKKGTVSAPILLSPESALKQVQKQEFVFGTLSQLAREESPTLLRDLQQAMQASNQIDDDHLPEIVREYSPSKQTVEAANGTRPFTTKRNLWAAASRGSDRGLLDVEMVDLSESPKISKSSPAVTAAPALEEMAASLLYVPKMDEWHELDYKETPVKSLLDEMEPPPSNQESLLHARARNRSKSPEKIDRGREELHLEANMVTWKPASNFVTHRNQNACATMPEFGGYTTVQLAKEIASYRFKPVKSRDQMILLLEKCWEGRQRVALGRKEPNAIVSPATINPVLLNSESANATTAEASKGPMGRPRMHSTSSNQSGAPKVTKEAPRPSDSEDQDKSSGSKPLVLQQIPKKAKRRTIIEEIDDSETPLTPSPPRRLRLQTHTPPLTLRPSTPSFSPAADDSLLLTPTSHQILLHQHITRAITTAPPSTDPKNPSWHEKILLYDPIVLEDLTTWLNTSALQRVGWDAEVDPKEVKVWCVAKSVCCFWRKNLRVGVRSHY